MTSFARTAQGLAIATLIAAVQPVHAGRGADRRRPPQRRSFYAGAHVGFMFGTGQAPR